MDKHDSQQGKMASYGAIENQMRQTWMQNVMNNKQVFESKLIKSLQILSII
jgi:hypothetical protein